MQVVDQLRKTTTTHTHTLQSINRSVSERSM